jgi:hypothetical protein
MAGILQEVTDVSSASQLLRYALAGQLELLKRQGFSQAKIAEAALGGSKSNAATALSHALGTGPTPEQLHKLDEIIGALSPARHGAGGLSSLALRVSEDQYSLPERWTASVPSRWTAGILKDHPSGEFGVLVQASALLSAFTSAAKVVDQGQQVDSIRNRYDAEMKLLVRRLVLLSAAPPTSTNGEAQIMLGTLAGYAFESMRTTLGRAVQDSPLSFRVWRAITKLVKLRGNDAHADALQGWVRQLIRESGELRNRSLYAGRSLDLELALAVPASWSPPEYDWVGKALRDRAHNPDATIRERGTAAMGLWQRAILQNRDLESTEDELRALIAEFRDPESRPDASAGLRWVAETLEHVIKAKEPVCNEWPEVDEPWFRNVQQAAAQLDDFGIPPHLLTGTKNLFLNMLLQNAGVYRRYAIETVASSGWSRPAAEALGYLLKREQDEAWLRLRAEFALSSLQRRNEWVERDLADACKTAYRNLRLETLPPDGKPPRARITEMHASLFAVGDCFGVAGAEERARSVRDRLRPILTELASLEAPRASILQQATRAVAYLLTVTAQRRENGQEDLSEVLLRKLSSHPDEVTAHLSKWALSFRFAPDGSIRPILDAADPTVVSYDGS